MAVVRRADSSVYWVEFWFEGKRYRRSTGTTVRRKAVEFEHRLRRQLHDELKLGRVEYVRMRFDEAVRRYKTTHLNTKSRRPKTTRSNEYMLKKLTGFIGADTLLHEITTPVVAKLKEQVLHLGRSPATVNRYLANLRAILRMAHMDWGTLPQLPRFRLFRLNNERNRWLREDEEKRLLNACAATPHLHQLVTFLLDTGARLSERVGNDAHPARGLETTRHAFVVQLLRLFGPKQRSHPVRVSEGLQQVYRSLVLEERIHVVDHHGTVTPARAGC